MTGVGNTSVLGFNAMNAKVKIPLFKINQTQITNKWRLCYKSIEKRVEYKESILTNKASVNLYAKEEDNCSMLLELRHLKILTKILGNMSNGTTVDFV